jgi:hypothetical protein
VDPIQLCSNLKHSAPCPIDQGLEVGISAVPEDQAGRCRGAKQRYALQRLP